VTPWQYARAAIREYFFHLDHGTPPLVVSGPGLEPTPVFLGLVCNTAPWTYLGERAVNPCPEATFEGGLDLFGLRKMRPVPTLKVLAGLFGKGPRGRNVVSLHDIDEVTVTATGPTALQVDGDYLGDATSVTLRSVRDALRVVVQPA
jgi:diacylglycerol kinase family enzyme